MQAFLDKLSGYKTYLALWVPVLAGLVFLLSGQAEGLLAAHVPEELAGTASWWIWVGILFRALDQTFMRIGVSKAEAAKKVAGVLLAAVLVFSLAACCPPGMIRASEVDGAFTEIRERHDKYVNADPVAKPTQKRIWLRSTALLANVIDRAQKKKKPEVLVAE